MEKKKFIFSIFSTLFIGFFAFSLVPIEENSAKDYYVSVERKEQKKEIIKTLKDFTAYKKEELINSQKSFFEIDLEEMKARIYQDGSLEKEIPVLTKGNNNSWSGVCSGLYQVLDKYKIAFSNVSKVYMPWSLHFYGMYYLHGEPYYPDGTKLKSKYSGGCIRFYNKDAEYIFNTLEMNEPILIIDKKNDGYLYEKYEEPAEITDISAESYLVADLDSYHLLAEKNYEEVLPIASLTKLMTAVTLTENKDNAKSVQAKESMFTEYPSATKLIDGTRYNIVELFHPLLTESSNDAAEVLSYALGREKTISLMNEKTKMIGMENTFFEDPSGLSEKNVSTTKDLFYLGRYIFNIRPILLRITKGEIINTFSSVRFKKLKNKNIFYENEDFIGGKTGYTVEAGNTGLFIFKLPLSDGNYRNIIIILLKSKHLEDDVNKVFTWWFNNQF